VKKSALRLSPDRLRIGLAPSFVSVERERGFLRKAIVDRQKLACDPGFGAQLWDGALAALKSCDTRLRATVVLSNHFVRYAIVPWTTGLDTAAEEEAYVRHYFARVHGERAKSWVLRWTRNGDTRLASAIDQGLLEALKLALPRLVSMQPYLMAAINGCSDFIPKTGAWLALVEDERACIALHAGGRWRAVQNARGAWLDLLERERHRAESDVPQLALIAGADPGAAEGWTFQRLQGGLSH
jgi:hypothetical protein